MKFRMCSVRNRKKDEADVVKKLNKSNTKEYNDIIWR